MSDFKKLDEQDPNKRPLSVRRQEHLKSARAGLMAIDRAMGMSISDIAKEYGVGPGTVKTYLSDAEEEGIVDHYRRRIYDRLAGKVCAVYEAHLDQGSLKAASELAHGLGILRDAPAKAKEKAITTLAEWRAEKEEDGKDAAVNE